MEEDDSSTCVGDDCARVEDSRVEEILEEFEANCPNACAEFVSTVLHAYGLPYNDTLYNIWEPADPTCAVPFNWINASALFRYLTEALGFKAEQVSLTDLSDLGEGTPVFYNDGTYSPENYENAKLFEPEYRFGHVAVTTGEQGFDWRGTYKRVPLVVDVNGWATERKHPYNHVSTDNMTVWVVHVLYP